MINPQPPSPADRADDAPLPPLPAAGLATAMPDWLREPPPASTPTAASAPATQPAPAGAARPASVMETLDPASLLTADDLPDWLRQLAGEPAVAAEPPQAAAAGVGRTAPVPVPDIPGAAAEAPGSSRIGQLSPSDLSVSPSPSAAGAADSARGGLVPSAPVASGASDVIAPPTPPAPGLFAAGAAATVGVPKVLSTSTALPPARPMAPPDSGVRSLPTWDTTPPARAEAEAKPASGRWLWLALLAVGLVVFAYLMVTGRLP